MTIASPSWRRALVLVAAVVGTLIVANPAQAQGRDGRGGEQGLSGLDGVTRRDRSPATSTLQNTGAFPAAVTTPGGDQPIPGWGTRRHQLHGGRGAAITVGGTLPGYPVLGDVPGHRPERSGALRHGRARQSGYRAAVRPVRSAADGRRVRTHTTGIVCPADIYDHQDGRCALQGGRLGHLHLQRQQRRRRRW